MSEYDALSIAREALQRAYGGSPTTRMLHAIMIIDVMMARMRVEKWFPAKGQSR